MGRGQMDSNLANFFFFNIPTFIVTDSCEVRKYDNGLQALVGHKNYSIYLLKMYILGSYTDFFPKYRGLRLWTIFKASQILWK